MFLHNGFVAWSMTPIIPQLMLEERIDDPSENDEVFFANLNDNRISRGGYLPDKKVNDMIAEWPDEIQATRVEGKFASFFGSVYKSYNRKVHVIKPFPIPASWSRYRAIDFGFTNPFVCLWLARDGDGNWYLYKEYYRSKTGIGEHIEAIKRLSRDTKYRATYADPENAEDRDALKKSGIRTIAARKDVARGIEMVQSKLKIKEDSACAS